MPDFAGGWDEPTYLSDADLNTLSQMVGDDGTITSEVPSSLARLEPHLFSHAIWNLVYLTYDSDEARSRFRDVVLHARQMREKLGRDIGLPLAAADYFANISREIRSPRLIDLDLFVRLHQAATKDPITGIGNRRAYREALATELARAERHGFEMVILLFDLDHFKRVNDEQGHAAGDRILQLAAEIIERSIRRSDLVARWGGEEFVVLMPQTDMTHGLEAAERIRRNIEEELRWAGVTTSGGIAVFPQHGADEHSLFAHADRTLYRAKAEGRNRISSQPHERRRFPRVEESFSIRVVAGNPDRSQQATTTNVGEGGFSFCTERPPSISSLVQGVFDSPSGRQPFVGRVVYVEESAPGRYDVGIEFVEIDRPPVSAD
jgi:diguanylate cyclase (GGDEF)-like protein